MPIANDCVISCCTGPFTSLRYNEQTFIRYVDLLAGEYSTGARKLLLLISD